MAVTEQQFIQAYSQMDADKQQRAYNAGNAQVKSWIDAYNASQNNDYTEGYNEGPSDYEDQGYYSSGAYNDVGGVNVGDWNYGEDTDRRQQEIINNLNQAYQQDPSRFANWDTFAQNFNYSYSGRSDKERQTMQNWYNQNVGNVPSGVGTTNGNIYGYNPNSANSTDFFFRQLMAGENLGGEGAAIDAARLRYQNYKVLAGMTPNQIASAISSREINPVGQEMQDLMSYSPALYAQVQAAMQGQTNLDDINAMGEGIYNGLTGTETNGKYTNYDMTTEYVKNASVIKQYNESLYKKIEGLGGDTAAYVAIVASMLQNPAIQGAKDNVEDLEGEVRKIQEQIYTIGDTARATLGSEAPEDLVSAYISQQTKQLQNQLRTTQNSLLVAQGKLNNQLTEVETMIDSINYGLKTYGTGEEPVYTTTTQSGSSSGSSGGYSTTPTSTPKTYDYQDDSQARLQEIANNLSNYANTNPELFKDRNTFNDFFKYNQRSAKQKQVLDAAWMKYGKKFGASSIGLGGGSTGTTTSTENDKRRRLMQGIIAGDVAGGYGKTAMKAYGFERELNEQEVMRNIALICAPSEYSSLLKKLGTGAQKELNDAIKTRIQNTVKANKSKIKTRLDSIKGLNKATKRKEEAVKLAKELGINFGTLGESAIISYYNSL